MKKYLQGVLLVLCVLFTQSFLAQKLYWVGGSGNFNDPAHWSLQSGGTGGAKTPKATDDVYFDENSFQGKSIISFIGNSQAHDFIFSKYTPAVIFSGLQHESISIHGNVQLNSYIDNQFAGDIQLISNEASTSVSFALTQLKGNLYFNGNTSWLLPSNIIGTDNATVYFKQGTFNLNNTSINSGNLIATAGVTINSNQTTYRVTNKFILPAGGIFNDIKSDIYAHIKDATKFQVDPSIHINVSSRLHNPDNVMSCNITQTGYSPPTCAHACNATVTFNIPAACSGSSNPIWAVWTNGGSGCNPPATTSLTPGSTYTVGGLCGCGTSYQILFTNDPFSEDSSYTLTGSQIIAGNQISITDPNPPQIQNFPVKIPPTCFGLCNGEISVQIVTGTGTSPLSSTWTLPSGGTIGHTNLHDNTTGNNKDTLKNACAGTYSVFLTDANGCVSATSTVNLTQPTKVVSAPTFTNPLCSGSCSGIIQDNPSGGTGTYTCTMDSAGGAGPNLAMPGCTVSGLCAGTYTVFAKDGNGCKDTNIVTITPPTVITFVKTPASGTLNIPCQSACSGSVSVTNVIGGTPGAAGYTFSWTPAGGIVSSTANSSTYSGLCGSVAGITYTCTIKDSNNCVKTTVFTVKSPPALTLTPTFTNPKCAAGQGASVGSATVIASGGVSGYTFTWNAAGTESGASPQFNSINSNIPGGTYTANVTDANGCKDSTTVILTPPPVLTASIATTASLTCPSLHNGQLCVSAGGGTGGYTNTWTPSAGTASCTPANLVSGTYVATVTDANSCTVTVSQTLVPPPSITVTTSATAPSCSLGPPNGSITLTAAGSGGFSYQWSCSASTASVVTGLAGGVTCNYTVTDVNHCTITGSVTTPTATPLTLSLTPTTLLCAGDCNAQINSLAGGGTGTYTYTWAGTGTNSVVTTAVNQTGMCKGNYTCTITDAHNCPLTVTTSIASPPPISITLTPTNPTCFGGTGSILGTIGGGTGGLTHTWTPSVAPNPANTLNPNTLPAGTTYTLSVTDGNGCIDSDTLTLISPSQVTMNLTTTSVTCAGGTGTASVTASGGVGGYQYNWNGGGFAAAPTFTTLPAGNYTIAVEDSKNCLATTQFFSITSPPTLIASVINLIKTCNGLCNGGGTASVSGGVSPYQFSWDVAAGPFLASDSVISTLCVGTHTLYVKDANGCTTSTTFSVGPLVNIAISVSSNTVSCNNVCDATGTASASGGFGTYTIAWVNTATCTAVASSCTAFSLCPGTQTIVATDANGCSTTTTITIVNPPVLTASVTTIPVTCFGQCTGAATVTPSGGTPAASAPFYNINWSAPLSSTVTTVSSLCSGTYTANIVDHNGCAFTQTVNIGVSGQFSVTPTLTPPSTCGASDGSISITVSGGSGTYTVNWTPVVGTPTVISSSVFTYTNIPAGSYMATITDASGCDTIIPYNLNSPTGPVMNYTVSNASCYNTCDGSATVVATGTNNPIQVTWQSNPLITGVGSITAPNLCGNPSTIYSVKAKDAIGCITFTTVVVTSPTQIIDHATPTNPTCGASNGSISLAPTGGSGGGYTFVWNGGSTSNPYTGLPAGIDTVTIKDGAGCTQQYTYTLTNTASPTVTVGTSSVTCFYLTNGVATATVTGGLPAYSYTWTTFPGGVLIPPSGVNISNVANLAAGNYSLNVSDANGCITNTVFAIAGPTAINPGFTSQNVLCNGGSTGSASVAPTGGTPGYTYGWNPAATPTTTVVNSLTQGNNYFVIITDANSCTDTVKFSISQPSALSATVTSTPPTCFGGSNGTATVTVTGGMPSSIGTYTYNWSTSTNTPVASNLSVAGGPYTVTASDSNGCSISKIVVYTVQPTQVNPNITKTNVTCGANCNGSITSTPGGGNGSPYTYTWTTGGTVTTNSNSSTYSNLCANNTYTLVVADILNCTDTTTITLNPPANPQLTYTTSAATCGASPCNGSITITSTVGNGSVTVNWLSPASSCGSSLTCNALCAGTYSIQLIDSTNCIDTALVALSDSNGPVVSMSFTNVSCNGSFNGVASETVTGGTTPYIYSWNTVPSVGTITSTTTSSQDSGLAAGTTYFSSVSDAAGCLTITTFTITEPPIIQDAPTITAATCVGINNGIIISSGSGGTPFVGGYLYSIDNGTFTATSATSFTFTGLSAGLHTVCIEDSVGCVKCFPYNVPSNSNVISQISATNVTCFGTCNGTATVSNINNGTSPYSIVWNDPSLQSGTFANNLCAGSYTAIVTDALGCMSKDTITITAPNSINPIASVTTPSCGVCNGVITLNPTGGTGTTYTYTWSNPGNTNSISNVCAGIYPVEITDSLGCQQNFQIPVSNSNSPTVTVISTNVSCNNTCNGSATVTASGGTTPYTYLWPNVPSAPTSSVVSSLCPNTISVPFYFVEVQDFAGCVATQSVSITAPSSFTVNNTTTSPDCNLSNGIITTTVVGASTYSYQWSANALGVTTSSVTNLPAGSYTLVVTDNASGCTQTLIIPLNNNAGPALTVVSTDVSCFGTCNGTATVTATGGTTPYNSIIWNTSPTQTFSVANTLCGDSTYAVTVTDGAGCIQIEQIAINQPSQLFSGISVVSAITCHNDSNGIINANIFGGTPSYSYTWTPSSVTGSGGINLPAGTYSAVVADANGCTTQVFDTLTNPLALIISGTVTPTSCNNTSDGAINTTTSGGTPAYTYTWSGGSSVNTPSLSAVPSGNYTVVVSDAKLCTDTANFAIIPTTAIVVNAGRDTALCTNAPIILTGTVTGTATFDWQDNNGNIIPPINTLTLSVNPTTTTQYVLAAYNGACRDSDTVVVTINPAALANAGASQAIFIGQSVNIGGNPSNPNGGIISWSPNVGLSDTISNNPLATPAVTTTYTLLVTNASGCTAMDTMIVTVLPPIVINSGFTPNGDGKNDTWVLDDFYKFPNAEVEIYNRWGEQLFYSKGSYTPWNGTYKGQPLPVGTYYYIIRLNDPKFPDHYAGPLTILR